MNQPSQYQASRRTGTYSSSQGDPNVSQHQQHQGQSPRDYAATGPPPHIKLDPVQSYGQQPGALQNVPNVLQPGGMAARQQAQLPSNAPPPTVSSMQSQSDYHSTHQSPSKSASLALTHSSYSRSSPSGYEPASSSSYMPYSPTAAGTTASSSQYMSPTEPKYSSSAGSQRPLGLADIRPRADSSLSDGLPGSSDSPLANIKPRTSQYVAPWALYAIDWCKWAPQGNSAGKLAVASYLEDGHNFIQILDAHLAPTPSDVYVPGGSKYTMEFKKIAEATHSYPVTRLLWEPPSAQKQSTDLLATSGDHLRLWSLPSDPQPQTPGSSITSRSGRDRNVVKLTPLALLSNSKTPDHTAPLTSLDWNTVQPSLIITSSIDTTCTIWDIPSLTAKTQLIAHDKEVYDVRWCANSHDVFLSCGQDGSVRMFDLRSLEHSTIIYEPTGKEDRVDANGGRMSPTTAQQTLTHPPPLLRLATSPHDTHLLATFAQDSPVVRILDVRQPGQALLELRGHGGAVNCVEWSPLRRGTLATGADDCQVLIWDLLNSSTSINGSHGHHHHHHHHHSSHRGHHRDDYVRGPVAVWQSEHEVNHLGWAPRLAGTDYGEWLGVSSGRAITAVRAA